MPHLSTFSVKERSALREGELSAIDKTVDLLSSEEIGRTQGQQNSLKN